MDDDLPLPSENPYAPPQAPVASASGGEVIHYEPASGGKRFANLLIDYVVFLVLVVAVSTALVFLDHWDKGGQLENRRADWAGGFDGEVLGAIDSV